MTMRREPVGIYPPSAAAAVLGLVLDVKRDYGASGSSASTTGNIASGSTTLTLAAPQDFVDGQGISVANAGTAPPVVVANPTAPTLYQVGWSSGFTGGTTEYLALTYLDGSGNETFATAVQSVDIGGNDTALTMEVALPFGAAQVGVYVGATNAPLRLGSVANDGTITYSGTAASGITAYVDSITECQVRLGLVITANASSTGAGLPSENTTSIPTAPPDVTVTPTGTTGNTGYSYAVAVMTDTGAITAASPVGSTTTGNATLSTTDYNGLTTTGISGGAAYLWYRTVSDGTPSTIGLISITKDPSLRDTGLAVVNTPPGVPASAPSSALGGWLVSAILSGAGTTNLTLADQAASTTPPTAAILHDDSAAINAALSSGGHIFVPNGTYLCANTLTITQDGTTLEGEGWDTVLIPVLPVQQCVAVSGQPNTPTIRKFRLVSYWSYFNCGAYGSIPSIAVAAALVEMRGFHAAMDHVDIYGGYCGLSVTEGDGGVANKAQSININAISGPALYLSRINPAYNQTFALDDSFFGSFDTAMLIDGGFFTLHAKSVIIFSPRPVRVVQSNGYSTPAYLWFYDVEPNNTTSPLTDDGTISPGPAFDFESGTQVYMSDCWAAANNLNSALRFGASYDSMATVHGGIFWGASAHTIDIQGGVQIVIDGAIIGGAPAGYAAVHVAAGVSEWTVANNDIAFVNAGGSYGVLVDAGASDQYNVVGNRISSSVTTALSDGGTGDHKNIANNSGYNPVGTLATPAIPSSGSAYTNAFGTNCTVYVTGGTVSAIAVNGTATGMTSGPVRVAAGQTITLTYSVAPTWTWFGE